MKQQSFKDDVAKLYCVATPIGNLKEMTPRAIEILNEVDVIAAEDTRTTQKLLSHFDIHTPCISHHLHNESASTDGILQLLRDGKNVALVSDAGYPLISDPGQHLVASVTREGFSVIPVSGSSAFLNALVASGLVVQPFAFMGFLEKKSSALEKQLLEDAQIPMTKIYYLSVHALRKSLETVYNVLGDIHICLARELTKQHEEFIRGSVSEVLDALTVEKGEFVLVMEHVVVSQEVSMAQLIQHVNDSIQTGLSVSKAIASVAKAHNVSKNKLYEAFHQEEL